MKKVLSILLIMLSVVCVSGCTDTQKACENGFDCVKIEDNKEACSYCPDYSKNCSNPKNVTCDINK